MFDSTTTTPTTIEEIRTMTTPKTTLAEYAPERGGFDYEMHRFADRWEIIAINHNDGGREELAAELAGETEAYQAWNQIMVCEDSGRGVMHHVSSTPSFEVKWFDPEAFTISSKLTRFITERDNLVAFYQNRAKFPVKVIEHKIEHWTENPLFAAE